MEKATEWEAGEEGEGRATLGKAFDLGEGVPRAVGVLKPNAIAGGWVEVVENMEPFWKVGVKFLAGDVARGLVEHVLEIELENGNTSLGRSSQGGKGVKNHHKGVCDEISSTWNAEGKLIRDAMRGNGLRGCAHHMTEKEVAEGGADTDRPEFVLSSELKLWVMTYKRDQPYSKSS